MRINKYIAGSGVTSRRGADKLVEEGRVKVNNKTVTTLGFEVNEDNDTVTVDGRKITLGPAFHQGYGQTFWSCRAACDRKARRLARTY